MSLPPSKHRRMSKSHDHAPKQEARLATTTGGRTVVGSGSGNEKGDVRITGIARLEAKTTLHKSFSVTRKLVEKIENEATGCGEMPAIVIDFINPDGTVDKSVAVIPLYALESLINDAS